MARPLSAAIKGVEAMTEQAIAEKALSAHATDEALGTAPNSHRCDQKDNPNASVLCERL
jgi:hypothetical protein